MAMRLAFLASGNGTTMRNIVGAIRDGRIEAEPALLIASKPDCGAVRFATAEGIPARHISRKTHADSRARDAAILSALKEAAADLVILSGYLHKIGPQVLRAFAPHIINIHPALLPRFGGQGMYGRRVHEAVLAAGARESGATAHIVDAEYDHGPVIAQRPVPVLAGDTAESLAARVEAAEKELMIETVRAIAAGAIDLAQLARASQP
jgi:phosphoribosylglycinamide formyltransferase-1